ncbi:MAG: tetratricopeptide repeat protein, partial [Planctomycetales bacterium]|nr:tetratricopeptide repeat protein [Planctomycetales bacterium]
DNAEAKIRRVTDQLRTQFPDADTMYAADANDVLGHIYQLRNQVEEARSCYHRALELANESRMNVDLLRQTVSNNLCGLDMMSGDYDKAIQGFQQHIEMLKAQLGDEHMQVIVSQANLAHAFLQNGDSDRCIELLVEAIQQSKRRNGPLHPVTIRVEVNLAGVYHQVGDIKNAAELSLQVATKLKKAIQIHDVALIDQLSGLGVVLGLSGMPEMALQVLDAAAVSSAKTRGPQHADTLVIKAKAARFCQLLGQMAESKNRLESVVPQMNDCPDVPIAERTVAANNLALARFQTGDPQAALQILQAVLPEMEEEFGVQHDNWLSAAGTLQWIYLQLGEFELAIQHSRKMLPVLEQKQRNSQELELVKTGLFEALVEMGEYNDAFAPLQKIAESSRPESANYWRITSLMGTCHWKLGRHAEADECLSQAAAGLESLRDKLPTYLTWWADRATARLTQFRQQVPLVDPPDTE